jgi:N utilization substance protein B
MQSAYALMIAESDKLDNQEHYLVESIERLHQLYIVQLQLMIAVLDKATNYFKISKHNLITTDSPLINSSNFINNKVLHQVKNSISLDKFVEKNNGINWKEHEDIVNIIWNKIQKSSYFETYMNLKSSTYQNDKDFILTIYKKIIAPNDQLAEFYENEVITWVDDIPFINTWIVGNLNNLSTSKNFIADPLYKDISDKNFALTLFRKTVLNYDKYQKDINNKTPNWDSERITKIDKLLMIMAITEFLHFPSIPTKVSINEYIEIAKDYATPKSSFFINGVLDKLLADYQQDKKIQKTGRGLM